MNIIKIKCLIFFAIYLIPVSTVFATARVESEALSVTKKYQNGNSVALTCNSEKKGECKLDLMIGKKVKRYAINFLNYDLKPTLDFVRIYANGKHEGATVVTSIECQVADTKVVSKGEEPTECNVQLTVEEGKLIPLGVEVFVYPKTYFREVSFL